MARLVFICGVHRSGTTMLEQYIYSHFEVKALRASVPENEGQFLQDVYKPAFHYGGPGKFAFSQKMQEDLKALSDYEDYARRILTSWLHYSVGEGQVLLEKSPPNITKMWWLKKVFPDSIFIVWTRDPRAVSGATQKWSNSSIEELMQHWDTAYSIAKYDIDPNTILMRYEDFCGSPETCIKKSRIDRFLKRRAKPLAVEQRFSIISNANEKYIKQFPEDRVFEGIWRDFGYNI